jgi:formiminotetrahydrofolate cyclodeaminase
LDWNELTINQFQEALSSKNPTPGGGTASALALGQSASLVAMVANLTIGNEKWSEGWEISDEALELANKVKKESARLAKEDSDSFNKVMAAFKLPKNTDDEKEIRRETIRNCTLIAAKIPYETAVLSLDLLKIMVPLSLLGNGNAISDVGVAALLASAGCKGALFNVEINLNSLPEDYGLEMREGMELINNECRTTSKEIMHNVKDRL